jgi:hypothetical protein
VGWAAPPAACAATGAVNIPVCPQTLHTPAPQLGHQVSQCVTVLGAWEWARAGAEWGLGLGTDRHNRTFEKGMISY